MTIEILQAEWILDSLLGDSRWECRLELSDSGEIYSLPATAPGELQENELSAYFEAQAVYLWNLAQERQYPADVFENIIAKRVLRAFVSVAMDEINILRDQHGLAPRTKQQLIQAIKNKLKE